MKKNTDRKIFLTIMQVVAKREGVLWYVLLRNAYLLSNAF